MTKFCNKCKTEKETEDFHKRGSGFQPYCKICKKKDDAEYRKGNMDYFVKRAKQQRVELYKWYQDLKSGPCAVCKQNFHFSAMDFDHLPEFDKVENIGTLMRSGSKQKILKEIAKCELICSNCHRVRTWNRMKIE